MFLCSLNIFTARNAFLHASEYRYCKSDDYLFSRKDLNSTFFCSDSFFNILVPRRYCFPTTRRHSKPFSSTSFNSWWNHRFSEQLFHFNVFRNVSKSELWCHAWYELFPHIFVRRCLPFDYISNIGLLRFSVTKILKFVESTLQHNDQLTIRPFVSFELPKTFRHSNATVCQIFSINVYNFRAWKFSPLTKHSLQS